MFQLNLAVQYMWRHAQVFLTPDYLAIAMEYADGGDMFQLVVGQRGLSESDARWYFQQLIIAIDYCHRMVSFKAISSAGSETSGLQRLVSQPSTHNFEACSMGQGQLLDGLGAVLCCAKQGSEGLILQQHAYCNAARHHSIFCGSPLPPRKDRCHYRWLMHYKI